jgi:hypothetical protein
MLPGRDLRGRTPSFLKLLFILMNLFTARNSSERALRHHENAILIEGLSLNVVFDWRCEAAEDQAYVPLAQFAILISQPRRNIKSYDLRLRAGPSARRERAGLSPAPSTTPLMGTLEYA